MIAKGKDSLACLAHHRVKAEAFFSESQQRLEANFDTVYCHLLKRSFELKVKHFEVQKNICAVTSC